MNTQHGSDEAFARLRASDPAADAPLDREALRQEVDRRIAGTAAPADQDPELAAVTPIRRPGRWWQAVAAVAAVAVVGGAGYAIGRGADAPATATPVPMIDVQSGVAGTEQATASMDRMWAPGRVVFTAADGLGDQPGRAQAWALDARAVSADTVAALAGALGVAGDPVQQEDGSWLVGSQDGSGPGVTVYSDGTAAVNYYDPERDPWVCAQAAEPAAELAEPDAVQTIDPVLPCEPATDGAPGAEAANAALAAVLTAVGLDPAEFAFSQPDLGGGAGTYVSAERVIDGQATGLVWSATVVADGVQSLSGQLAPVVSLGDYDVIGAATAVQRMADPRFGAGYAGIMPLATADAATGLRAEDAPATGETGMEIAPAPRTTPPPTVAPGAAIDWPVQRVTITAARLGLSQVVQSDGSVLLAPAYEFTGDDGGTWGVIAVAESALSFG